MDKKEKIEFEEFEDLLKQFEKANANSELINFTEEEFEDIIYYYLQNNQAQLALEACEMALRLYPFSSEFCLSKADAHLELGELDEAESFLINNFKIDKSDVDYYILLSEVYVMRNSLDKAKDICYEGIEKCKESLDEIYLHLAEIYDHQGEYNEVIALLENAIAINPANDDAIYLYSITMTILDRVPEKIAYFQSILDKDPFSEFAWYYIAIAYREAGEYDKAIEALEYLSAIDEENNILPDLAQVFYDSKQYKQAIDCFKEIEAKEELDYIACLTLAKCYKELGEIYKAKRYFKESLSLDDNNEDAYFELALLFYFERNHKAALPLINKALEKIKDMPHFLELKADILIGLENVDEACELYKDIIQLNNSTSYYLGKFAYVTAMRYGLPAAIQILDNGLIEHNYPVLHYHKAILYFLFEKEEKGFEEFAAGLASDYASHTVVFDKLPHLAENKMIQSLIELYGE